MNNKRLFVLVLILFSFSFLLSEDLVCFKYDNKNSVKNISTFEADCGKVETQKTVITWNTNIPKAYSSQKWKKNLNRLILKLMKKVLGKEDVIQFSNVKFIKEVNKVKYYKCEDILYEGVSFIDYLNDLFKRRKIKYTVTLEGK